MLLTNEYIGLLEADGKEKYKAKKDLNDEQLVSLIEFDEAHHDFYGEHIITNINEVKAAHNVNVKLNNR